MSLDLRDSIRTISPARIEICHVETRHSDHGNTLRYFGCLLPFITKTIGDSERDIFAILVLGERVG